MAVAIDSLFFAELPTLPEVAAEDANIAWLVYDLVYNKEMNRYFITSNKTVYTQFTPALLKITTAEPGPETRFRSLLQKKLREKLSSGKETSDTANLDDLFGAENEVDPDNV